MLHVFSPTGAYMGEFSFVDAWQMQEDGYQTFLYLNETDVEGQVARTSAELKERAGA